MIILVAVENFFLWFIEWPHYLPAIIFSLAIPLFIARFILMGRIGK